MPPMAESLHILKENFDGTLGDLQVYCPISKTCKVMSDV